MKTMAGMRVVPGIGVGEFTIGRSLNDVLGYLRRNALEFRRVNLEYSESPTDDILIVLPWEAMRLVFSSPSQILRSVSVTSLDQVTLQYEGIAFGGPCQQVSFKRLYSLFGPTQFGEINEDSGSYMITYEGMTLGLDIPLDAISAVLENPTQQPFVLPDGRPLLAQRLCVTSVEPLKPPPVAVQGKVGQSRWVVGGVEGAVTPSVVNKGDTPTDVLYEFGDADDIVQGTKVYSFRYYSRGVEVLFDAATHVVCALILHTGIMHQHSMFRFEPCHFEIFLNDEVALSLTTLMTPYLEGLIGNEAPTLLGHSCVYDIPGRVKIETFPIRDHFDALCGRLHTVALLL